MPVYYAVIALVENEVQGVVEQLPLKALDKDNLLKWINDNKIYGKKPEDWRPFNCITVKEIVNSTGSFNSQTHVILNLEDYNKTKFFRNISIFFIDGFAMWLDNYSKLADTLDKYLSEGKASCCFSIYYGIPIDVQEILEKKCSSIWQNIYDDYSEGFLHRIAARVNDLANFNNYLKGLLSADKPSLNADHELSHNFASGSLPRNL